MLPPPVTNGHWSNALADQQIVFQFTKMSNTQIPIIVTTCRHHQVLQCGGRSTKFLPIGKKYKSTITKYTTCHHDQLLQCSDRSSTAFQMQFVSFISVFDFSTFNWSENSTETFNCEVLNWNILESRCWGKKRRSWETTSSSRSRRKCQASTFSWSYHSCTSLGEARTRWFNLVVHPS